MNKMSKKLGKRVLSWLLCVALVVALMPGMEMRRVKAATLNGSGTAEDPYQISNYTELLEFAKLVNRGKYDACAVLTRDIDASASADYFDDSLSRWWPIGSGGSIEYIGTFDGRGRKITNLVVVGKDYTGVFGCLGNGGVIKNLFKEGGSVTGQQCVGGIVGHNVQGTIENCCNTGTVSGTFFVGGVVGADGNSFSAQAFTITNCYNTGAVSGNNHVGGVVGASYERLWITNCYNIGPVTGTDNEALIGGIAGASGFISSCYNIGEVTGTGAGAYVGGITGYAASSVEYCFYNTDLCHVPSGVVGEEDVKNQVMGLTTEQMTGPNPEIRGGSWYFLNSTSDYAYYPHLQDFDLNEYGLMSVDEIVQTGRWPAKAAVGYEVKLAEGTLTYNGQEQTPTIVISKGGVDLGASDYVLEGVTKATNAGTYPFKYTILSTGAFAAGTFEIKKVSAPSTLAEENKPVAKTDLKENGSAQALLTAPSAFPEGYTIEYSTDNGESWSTDVPTGKEAKEYAVLVRYKGDQNHEDFDGETLTVTIGEASIDGLSWNEEEECYEITNYAGLKAFADIVNGTATIVDKSGKGNAANAKLMNNIECKNNPTDTDYATDWMPICDDHKISEGLYLRYEGTFDGQEHVIKGLNNTDNGAILYAGLFGAIGKNGIVRKLFLEDGCFTGNYAVGGIAGYNYGSIEKCCNGAAVSGGTVVGGVVGDNYGEVHNCQNTGTVVGVQKNSIIGGIVGSNFGDIIENCHNAADIVVIGDYAYVGGIVGSIGSNRMSTVENCNNTGAMAVTGYAAFVGGIVGGIVGGGDRDIIKNCYNAGAMAVTGDSASVGGILGYSNNSQIIKNCYNAGAMAVTGNNARVGGIVGELSKGTVENSYNIGAITKTGKYGRASGVAGTAASATFTNCYFDKEMCAITVNGVAVAVDAKKAIGDQSDTETVKGLTTAQMTGEGALERMGFSSENWNEHENDDDSGMAYYPFPKGFTYDGSQSAEDWPARVCCIDSYAKLKTFADIVNGTGNYVGKADPSICAVLTADIECKNDPSDKEFVTDWYPIGDGPDSKYTGTFDGQGHVIKGLNNADNKATLYAGLFGVIGQDGVVKNLGLEDGSISGGFPEGSQRVYIGSIAGRNEGIVQNCYNTGTVTGVYNWDLYVGGLIGSNEGQTGAEAKVLDCYNTGTVVANSEGYISVGGIIGRGSNNIIKNCHNEGTVTGAMTSTTDSYSIDVGGIVGEAFYNSKDSFSNCYNTGDIRGTGKRHVLVGGVVGYSSNGGGFANCYNMGSVFGAGESDTSVGGVMGVLSGVDATNCFSIGSVSVTAEREGLVGGVIGNAAACTITNCYFDTEKSVITENGKIVSGDNKRALGAQDRVDTVNVGGLTTAQMTGANALTNMGFSADDWYAHANDDPLGRVFYPHLKGFEYDKSKSDADWPAYVCCISNYAQLKAFADLVNGTGDYAGKGDPSANAILMADIECKYNASDAEYAKDWMPIGDVAYDDDVIAIYHNIKYMGVFDGQGHVIRGLSNTGNANTDYAGLFGCIGETGVVKNLGLQDEEFAVRDENIKDANRYVGSIAAYNYGEIRNCYNTGSIGVKINKNTKFIYVFMGGIVARNYGSVDACYNAGAISGEVEAFFVGGVAGWNNGTIQNCYNAQSVTMHGYNTYCFAGGVVGENLGYVFNCYNIQSVTAETNDDRCYVGGVAGDNENTIQNCYNVGSVKGQGKDHCYVGGAVGFNNWNICDCYNVGSVTAQGQGDVYVGGVAGYSYGNSLNCYSVGSVTAQGQGSAYVGGVIGFNILDDECITRNCFYNTDLCDVTGAINGKDDETNNIKGLTMAEMSGSELEAWFKPSGSQETCWLYAENVEDSASDKVTYYYPHLKGFNLTADGKQMDAKDIVQAGAWPAYTEYYWDDTTLTEVTKTPTNGVSITWKYQLNSIKTEARVVGMSVEDYNAGYSDFIEMPSVLGGAKVTEIGTGAFKKDALLQQMDLPDSLKKIGDLAFNDCKSLQEIMIPDGVTYIGENAFGWCRDLEKVTLSKQLKSIEKDCFIFCTGLSEIEIPVSVTAIHETAFEGCIDLSTIYFEGSKEDWEKIQKGEGWSNTTKLTDDSVLFKIKTVTFQVKNGKWSDGKTEDKTVTVEGYDAKLNASSVPALGNPNQGYQAGSWSEELDFTNPVPNLGKTYVYSFAELPKYEITVVAASNTGNVYDGEEKSAKGFLEIQYEENGEAKTANVQGESALSFTLGGNTYTISGLSTSNPVLTKKGTLANEITGTAVVTDAGGNDVTTQFTVNLKNGTLEVKPTDMKIRITSGTKSWTYDGMSHAYETYTVSYGGSNVAADQTGKVFELPTGDKLTIAPVTKGVKDYDKSYSENNTFNYSLENDNQYNNITATVGTLTITKRAVSVSVADKEVQYNGNEQQGETTCTFTDLVSGHVASITYTPAKGTLTNTYTGSFNNDFRVHDGAGIDVTDNYDLTTKTVGKLLVKDRTNKYEITVVANSNIGNVYDGTEKSVSGFETLAFTVEGNAYTVSGLTTSDPSSTNVCNLTNAISGIAVVKDAQGNDVTAQFTVHTTEGVLTITKREVTVSVADKEVEYNGSEQQGETTCTFANIVSGQTATITYAPAKGTLASKTSYNNGSFDAGTFKVTDGAGDDVTANYDLTAMTAGKLTVKDRTNKYEITVVAKSSTGNVYDGTEKTVSGFEKLMFQVEGKTYSVEGLKTSNPALTQAGTIANEITGTAVVKDSQGNDVTAQFTVSTENGTLEIAKRAVTVSVADKEVEYNGNEQQGETAYAFANVVSGETATITYKPTKGTLANKTSYDNGSFDKSTFKVTDGAGNDLTANYDLTTMTAGKLLVKDRTNKYEITVVANSNIGNVYDGTEKSVSGFETLEFTVEGNAYTVSGLTTSDPSGTNVCSLTNAVTGTAVVKDANGNDVTAQFTVYTTDGVLEITKREVTVSVADKEVEYNGNEQQGETAYAFANLVSGQTATITYVPAKGTLVNTGSYDNGSFDKNSFKVVDGAGNDLTGNYDLTAATAGKLTIKDRTNKYGITVKANSNTGNIYDGTEKKAAGFETLSFTVDGNAYTVEGLTTHDPASTNVCSLVNMILGTAVVKDANGNDVTAQFTVTTQDGTLEIGKRAVTVSVADRSVEYNGSEQQGETAYAFTNMAEGQTATIAYAPAKGKLAGTTGYDNGSFDKNSFKVVDGAGNDVTANYDLTAMTAGKLTIKDRTEKYVITVKSNGNTGNIYDRTEKSAKGFERLTFQVEGKTYTVEGLTSSNPKSTGICSLTNEISGNAVVKDADGNDVTAQFTVRKEEGKLEIQPRAATVTVLSKSKEFGNQDPKFAVEVTGVLDGDALEITFVREIGEEPGTYKVSAKVTPNANYVITCVDGVLTINKDYVEDLRQKLLNAIAAGGEQTVNWNEGTSLPYDVMKLLQDHPLVTLIFSYTYGGKDYKVTIPGKIARAYTSIPWYGPLYLYGAYGDGASLAGGDDSTLGSRIYKVVKGDCLSKIARKLGLKWVWLQKINNLRNPNLIYPGQEIRY